MKYVLCLLLLGTLITGCQDRSTAPITDDPTTIEEKPILPYEMGGDPDGIGIEVHWVTTLDDTYVPPGADLQDGMLVKAFKERPVSPYAGRPMYVTWGQIKAIYRG